MDRRKFIALTSAGTAVALLPRAGRTEYTFSEAHARARELVAEMTLDEKTLLMTGNRFNDVSQYNKAGARHPNPNYGCPRLGMTVHLLEDMGGPAHVRNDGVVGHVMLSSTGYRPGESPLYLGWHVGPIGYVKKSRARLDRLAHRWAAPHIITPD